MERGTVGMARWPVPELVTRYSRNLTDMHGCGRYRAIPTAGENHVWHCCYALARSEATSPSIMLRLSRHLYTSSPHAPLHRGGNAR